MKPRGSNFVSRTGLIVLLVLTLAAGYMRIATLTGLLTALLLLCVIAYIWGELSLKNIQVETVESDCRAFPGEIICTEAKIKNAKFLPLIWIEAAFPKPDGACVAAVDDENAPVPSEEGEPEPEIFESFLWVMPQQGISWSQRALAVKRGVCRVDGLDISSGDGFGLSVKRRHVPLSSPFRFIVYPKIYHVNVEPIIRHMTELEKSSRGLYTDPTLINNIRDYREGDPVRDINWRMLARSGTVQVNVKERMDMRRVCLIPDLESFSETEIIQQQGERREVIHLKSAELEKTLSVMASCIAELNARHVLCSLAIPSFKGQSSRIICPDSESSQVMELLTALAEIDYPGGKTEFDLCGMSEGRHLLGQMFMFGLSLTEIRARFDAAGLPMFFVLGSGADTIRDRRIISEREITEP